MPARIDLQPARPRPWRGRLGDEACVLIRSRPPPMSKVQRLPDLIRSSPMPRSPLIVRTVPALRRALDGLRARKASVALVPTMGALHDGHVSLVRLAKRRAKKVVVSIFVNPTQFAPTEDFGSYPRTWKADVAKLAAEGVDLIWNPDVEDDVPGRVRDTDRARRAGHCRSGGPFPAAFLRRRRHRGGKTVHASAGRRLRSSAKRIFSSCGWWRGWLVISTSASR